MYKKIDNSEETITEKQTCGAQKLPSGQEILSSQAATDLPAKFLSVEKFHKKLKFLLRLPKSLFLTEKTGPVTRVFRILRKSLYTVIVNFCKAFLSISGFGFLNAKYNLLKTAPGQFILPSFKNCPFEQPVL